MNNIKKNYPMFFYDYADEIQLLFFERYFLITKIAENGPCIEVEYFYNPDDSDPVIENHDVVTALAEIDQKILDLVTKASKEDWFHDHQRRMYMEHKNYENRQRAIANGSLAQFLF